MLVVGLTGGIGSGKSTVARMFADLGVPVIDADDISHVLTAREGAAIPQLYQAFGSEIFTPDGTLNRTLLRARILADARAKLKLEAILHPMIRDEFIHRLNQANAPYVLVVIPLLVETGGYRDILDRVLVVDCSESAQINRVLARSAWSREEVVAMMSKQADRKTRLVQADDVIDNEGDKASLSNRVACLHQAYLKLAGQ